MLTAPNFLVKTLSMQEDPKRNQSFRTALRSDSEVIKLYLNTRETAYFSLLYNRYAGKIFSKCISMLKDEGLAQDATQDIFVKIFANLAKFSEKSKFSTWIYSITYNYCIDFIRRRKKEKNLFTSEMDTPPDIVEDVDDKELLEIEIEKLKVVLNEIPIGDKAILMMKYQEDMSIKEIAEALDKTESAIKMKIKRAKAKALGV
jgi:RNA polymerase sigma factor (sigma-70 family)